MQKDLSEATEKLAEGLNKLHENSTNKNLMSLVKRQAQEIDRRGQLVMKLEESMKLQQENILKLQQSNKHLEALVEDLKNERAKLLEEIKDLKAAKRKTPKTRAKKVKKEGDVTEAA